MRWEYKTVTNKIKKYIQNIYNLMSLSVNSIVIILINNKSIQVMNEVDIKTSIRIYFRPVYDKDNSAMENLHERLNLKKFESLMKKFQVFLVFSFG